MNMQDYIRHWASLCESTDSEDIDYGTIIGTFTVDKGSLNEMGSVGRITYPHQFYVYIHPNEGMTPHFHVFDRAGMHRSETNKDGFHTCIEIRHNAYFKHAAYTDELDKESMKALDKFMSETRSRPQYRTDIGVTNFVHTVNEWDDNNAEEGNPNWVDPDTTEKPDYTNIADNL